MRITLLSILLLLFSSVVYAEVPPKPSGNEYVYDVSNVIDGETEEKMRALARQVEDETGNQVVLLTVETLDGMDVARFGQQVIEQWEIGQPGVDNGMLIFATTGQGEGNNRVWISVGKGLEDSFYDPKIERIIDKYMVGSLEDGNYAEAFYNTLSIIGQEMLGEIEDADPYEDDQIFWMIIGGLFLVFLLWVLFYLGPKYGTSSNNDYDHYDSNSGSSGSGYGGGDSDGGGSGRSF